jgi:hypothetical protein
MRQACQFVLLWWNNNRLECVPNLSRGGSRRLASFLMQTEGFEQLRPFGAETHMRQKGVDRVSFIFSRDNDDVKTEKTRRTLPVCFRPQLLRCRRCLCSRMPKAYLDWRPPLFCHVAIWIRPRGGRQTVGVNRDRRGHRHNGTLLLRRGKEPKGPFSGLHLLLPLLLLSLLLPLLLQCRKWRTKQ